VRQVTRSRDGIEIQFETGGTGSPALVFVHGWSCDRSYFAPQLASFAGRHRVASVDLAGHGDSGNGRTDWSVAAFGADVAAVVDALDLDDVVLVGHSMGGDVIVDAAALLPGRVRGLVWVDVYTRLGEPRTPEDREAFLAPFLGDFAATTEAFVRRLFGGDADRRLVDRVAADMAAAPPHIAVDALRHSIANDGPILDLLARLTVPIVAINAAYRPTDEASLARYGIRTVIQQGVGHFGMLEDRSGFDRLLAGVVADLA